MFTEMKDRFPGGRGSNHRPAGQHSKASLEEGPTLHNNDPLVLPSRPQSITETRATQPEGGRIASRDFNTRLGIYSISLGVVGTLTSQAIHTAFAPWSNLYAAAVIDNPNSPWLEPVRLVARLVSQLGVNPRNVSSIPLDTIALCVAGAGLIAYGANRIIKSQRDEMRGCTDCGYDLEGVPTHGNGCVCPECGTKNTPPVPSKGQGERESSDG
jgi:hypothetical protein